MDAFEENGEELLDGAVAEGVGTEKFEGATAGVVGLDGGGNPTNCFQKPACCFAQADGEAGKLPA